MDHPDEPDKQVTDEAAIDHEMDRLLEWESEGINTYILRYLFENDWDAYQKAKIEVMKKQLEGELPERINDHLIELFGDIEEEGAGPLLLGRPLKDIEEEMEEMEDISPPFQEAEEETFDQTDELSVKEKTDFIPQKKISDSSNVEIDFEKEEDKIDYQVPKEGNTNTTIGRKFSLTKKHYFFLSIIAVAVVAILIATYFFIPQDNKNGEDELDPYFDISDNYPIEGSRVKLESRQFGKGIQHSWSINPSYYQIIEGRLNSINMTVAFTRSGNYSIMHTLERGEETVDEIRSLEVDKRTIRVGRERYGDMLDYDVEGTLIIEDFEAYMDLPDSSKYETAELEFNTRSGKPQTIKISENPVEEYNGFSGYNQLVQRISEQELVITGSVKDWQGTSIPFSGETQMTQRSLVDIYYKRPVRSDIEHYSDITISINPTPKNYEMSETVKVFPRRDRDFESIRIEDISENRIFVLDQSGEIEWGSTILEWNAGSVEIINDLPCINLSLQMSEGEMEKFDIDEFVMNIWIADSYSATVRTHISMSTSSESPNEYTLEYDQKLSSFSKGNDVIIYGTAESRHDPISDISQVDSRFGYQYDSQFEYVPDYGNMSSSIPSDFTAQNAISSFEEKPGFQNFIRGLNDPYGLKSNFTISKDGKNQWTFTISEDSERYGWNQTVREGSQFELGAVSQIATVSLSKSDIGAVLTYSASETALKILLKDIDPDMANTLYGVNSPGDSHKLDLSRFSINTDAERPFPSVGMVNPTIIEPIPYGFVLESKDNSIDICVDMQSGQICYVYRGSINSF